MTAAGMAAGPRFDHYDWRGGREAMLRFGPDGGPTVVVALPLLEEANRTRGVVVAMLRLLADRGIAGVLPDLPGQGESVTPTRDARLANWRAAFASAAATSPAATHVVAIRGGALVDGDARVASRWYLSPMEGAAVAREWERLHRVAEDDLFGGNDLSPELLAAMPVAMPSTTGPTRTVRLTSDARSADAMLPFAPPWRRIEPQRDDALSAALADDIAAWIASCAG